MAVTEHGRHILATGKSIVGNHCSNNRAESRAAAWSMTSLRECACAGGNGMLRSGNGRGHSDVGMMGLVEGAKIKKAKGMVKKEAVTVLVAKL